MANHRKALIVVVLQLLYSTHGVLYLVERDESLCVSKGQINFEIVREELSIFFDISTTQQLTTWASYTHQSAPCPNHGSKELGTNINHPGNALMPTKLLLWVIGAGCLSSAEGFAGSLPASTTTTDRIIVCGQRPSRPRNYWSCCSCS